jgi:predicted glycoside hydrolase/deacetylase ChbG (UPF0249 family)
MAKRLIINADDYGLSEDVNKRIIDCLGHGGVTDISILAVGDSFRHAAELARANKVDKIGAHIALTGFFKPVSPVESVRTLVGGNRRFPKSHRSFLARYFRGAVKKDEIYGELKEQISKIKNIGFKITHLDSHEHIHMAPGILKIAARLMEEEGIEYIRFPLERVGFFRKLRNPHLMIRNMLLSFMCSVSKNIFHSSGMKYADDFIGHASALRLRKEELILAVSNLKEGLTELSCHPGNREEEARIFCDTDFLDELRRHSVELVSY